MSGGGSWVTAANWTPCHTRIILRRFVGETGHPSQWCSGDPAEEKLRFGVAHQLLGRARAPLADGDDFSVGATFVEVAGSAGDRAFVVDDLHSVDLPFAPGRRCSPCAGAADRRRRAAGRQGARPGREAGRALTDQVSDRPPHRIRRGASRTQGELRARLGAPATTPPDDGPA